MRGKKPRSTFSENVTAGASSVPEAVPQKEIVCAGTPTKTTQLADQALFVVSAEIQKEGNHATHRKFMQKWAWST